MPKIPSPFHHSAPVSSETTKISKSWVSVTLSRFEIFEIFHSLPALDQFPARRLKYSLFQNFESVSVSGVGSVNKVETQLAPSQI